MSMCYPDNSGRPKPVPVEGSWFIIDADVFIQAIGHGPNLLLITELDGIVRGKRGNIIFDEEGRTALRHVYAGGDVAAGATTVILTMGAAKKAAHAIDRMRRNKKI